MAVNWRISHYKFNPNRLLKLATNYDVATKFFTNYFQFQEGKDRGARQLVNYMQHIVDRRNRGDIAYQSLVNAKVIKALARLNEMYLHGSMLDDYDIMKSVKYHTSTIPPETKGKIIITGYYVYKSMASSASYDNTTTLNILTNIIHSEIYSWKLLRNDIIKDYPGMSVSILEYRWDNYGRLFYGRYVPVIIAMYGDMLMNDRDVPAQILIDYVAETDIYLACYLAELAFLANMEIGSLDTLYYMKEEEEIPISGFENLNTSHGNLKRLLNERIRKQGYLNLTDLIKSEYASYAK